MPVSHPTILIGYGTYGQTVLRRLLENAASRGTLSWEGVVTPGGPGPRRVKNLSLMSIAPNLDVENLFSSDLQREIQTIWPSEEDLEIQNQHLFVRGALTRAVKLAKDQLFNATGRTNDSKRLRLGLDVIVVAHVSAVDVLGALEDFLQPAMDVLASDPYLRSPGAGQDLLNFVLMLDFDTYWDRSPAGRILRTETSKFADRWQERKGKGLPSFGRIYLSDGDSQSGHRDLKQRIDENTLFLEFALFEGLRDQPSLQQLYQAGLNSGVLATFNIRVIEDNRGLLSKLAAARYACGWLEYLTESKVPGDTGVLTRLASALEPYRARALEEAVPREELSKRLSEKLMGLENNLLNIPLGKGWVSAVTYQMEEGRLGVKTDLANWAGYRMQEIATENLTGLRASLEKIITSTLHDHSTPAPLGAVLDELKKLQDELEKASRVPDLRQPVEDSSSESISEAYREYERFVANQLDVEGNRPWWPLLGLVLSAVWMPILIDAANEFLPTGDDSSWISQTLRHTLNWVDKPSVLVPLCTALVWWMGSGVIIPWFRRRISRGRQLFDHPERGLLADRVRAAVWSGFFRHSIDAHAENLMYEMVQRLRNEVWWEVVRVRDFLGARSREMDWLRMSLRDFQKGNGLHPDGPAHLDSGRISPANCRFSTGGDQDLAKMLREIPPTPEGFRSAQASRPRFEKWNERYCGAFLYPIAFLEDLSQQYERLPEIWSLSEPIERQARARKLTELIRKIGVLHSGMHWNSPAGDAACVPENYCILPPTWRDLPNILADLDDYGFTEARVLESSREDRAYLLSVQLGLDSARLRNEEPT